MSDEAFALARRGLPLIGAPPAVPRVAWLPASLRSRALPVAAHTVPLPPAEEDEAVEEEDADASPSERRRAPEPTQVAATTSTAMRASPPAQTYAADPGVRSPSPPNPLTAAAAPPAVPPALPPARSTSAATTAAAEHHPSTELRTEQRVPALAASSHTDRPQPFAHIHASASAPGIAEAPFELPTRPHAAVAGMSAPRPLQSSQPASAGAQSTARRSPPLEAPAPPAATTATADTDAPALPVAKLRVEMQAPMVLPRSRPAVAAGSSVALPSAQDAAPLRQTASEAVAPDLALLLAPAPPAARTVRIDRLEVSVQAAATLPADPPRPPAASAPVAQSVRPTRSFRNPWAGYHACRD